MAVQPLQSRENEWIFWQESEIPLKPSGNNFWFRLGLGDNGWTSRFWPAVDEGNRLAFDCHIAHLPPCWYPYSFDLFLAESPAKIEQLNAYFRKCGSKIDFTAQQLMAGRWWLRALRAVMLQRSPSKNNWWNIQCAAARNSANLGNVPQRAHIDYILKQDQIQRSRRTNNQDCQIPYGARPHFNLSQGVPNQAGKELTQPARGPATTTNTVSKWTQQWILRWNDFVVPKHFQPHIVESAIDFVEWNVQQSVVDEVRLCPNWLMFVMDFHPAQPTDQKECTDEELNHPKFGQCSMPVMPDFMYSRQEFDKELGDLPSSGVSVATREWVVWNGREVCLSVFVGSQ